MSFPTVGVRCRECPISLSFRALHRSGCHDKHWSLHTTTSAEHNRAMIASCFPPLASVLAEAVETTIEFSGVKVKRQSLTALRWVGNANGIIAPVSTGVHPRNLHRPDAAWNLCTAACACRYARWLCRASIAMADAARTILPALSSPKDGLEYCTCVQYRTSVGSSLCHWPSWRRTASYLLAFGCVICSLPCLMTTTCSWSGLFPLSRTDKHPESPTTQATGS